MFDCAFTLHGHMFWAVLTWSLTGAHLRGHPRFLTAGNGKASCSSSRRCRVVCWGGGAAVKVAATV